MRIAPVASIKSEKTKAIVNDICRFFELGSPSDNLLLLANFEETLEYLWKSSSDILVKLDLLLDGEFVESMKVELQSKIANSLSSKNYSPDLVNKLFSLTRGHLKLTLWYLVLREALKGVPTVYLQKINDGTLTQKFQSRLELEKVNQDSLVAFPNELIALLSRYQKEVQNWSKSYEYLFVRLFLEEKLLGIIADEGLSIRFDLPKLFASASTKKNLGDLWYLLLDYCPSTQTRYLLLVIYLSGEAQDKGLLGEKRSFPSLLIEDQKSKME